MDPALLPGLFALVGALVGLAAAALWVALGRARARRRDRVRLRRGRAGERRGRTLLERAGWEVLSAQPPAELTLAVDGAPRVHTLAADYLCRRGERLVPAEVKTGAASDVGARATRRQLLEYALAYRTDAVLLVDADAGTVREVAFPVAEAPGRARSWPLLAAILGGAAAGLLGGYLLWGPRP